MTTLGELASLIRSKNAGPFVLTLDVVLPDEQVYRRVARALPSLRSCAAKIMGVAPDEVEAYAYEPGLSIKLTGPRRIAAGSPGDPDVFGGQQYAPLVCVEIPE